ncbi:MAG TPA: VIT1/CCC1 family protein [Actinotalea caeni]|uniref:VIT1/CCC1 transporter family protein n=1 Tax=Actinotalea caeni TaxID=1348467 RepID=UPI002B4B44C7|nr:VIT1/CCC1 family protein [Actinotalea caeni]HLV55112.1 VIT1/CCC1 family protein [Actinotalea caeni]
MTAPTRSDIRRWRRYLAEERAEAAVYRELAERRHGEEREILHELAEAERRHAEHWETLLGPRIGLPLRPSLRSRALTWLAGRFGSVFVLALAQRAESRSAYATDADATAAMAADEQIHSEVVRSLAQRGRARISGTFRAAVFGMNDGLVSNLALVLGIGAAGTSRETILLTGLAGLLAGALSMGAGEYVSVRSQRELLAASTPSPETHDALADLDVDANELALVYRARGMPADEAARRAEERLAAAHRGAEPELHEAPDHEEIGSAWGAAISSFCFFASGALIPVLPYLLGLTGLTAVLTAAGLVGVALMVTGAIVGVLSGAPPLGRALRQLAIGWGASAATYGLGLLFGTTVS